MFSVNLRGKKITTFDNSNPVSTQLKNGIYWDEDNYDIFLKYRRPNTNFIDAGAYVGTASLLMYDILHDLKENNSIHCFEPLNHLCTEKNIVDNNLTDTIKLYKVGLGSQNCNIDRWTEDGVGFPGSSMIHLNGTPEDNTKKTLNDYKNKDGEIEIRTLDSYNFSNIGFIKIDCEGMELDILKGAKECITNNNFPPLFIEIWKQEGWRKDVEYYDTQCKDDIYNFLLNHGYHKGIQINADDHLFLNEDDYNRTL